MNKKRIAILILTSGALVILMLVLFFPSKIEITAPKDAVTVSQGDSVNFEIKISGFCMWPIFHPFCSKMGILPFSYGISLVGSGWEYEGWNDIDSIRMQTYTAMPGFTGNLRYKFDTPGIYQITAIGWTVRWARWSPEIGARSSPVTVRVLKSLP